MHSSQTRVTPPFNESLFAPNRSPQSLQGVSNNLSSEGADRLDPERMTGIVNALSRGFQKFVGDLAGIASATRLLFSLDGVDKSERVRQRLLEYRVQKFEEELKRRFIVVVKDNLAVAGSGLNITHLKIAPD